MDIRDVLRAVEDGEGFAFLTVAELDRAGGDRSVAQVLALLEELGCLHLPARVPTDPNHHVLVYRARGAVASVLMLQHEIEAPGLGEDDREALTAMLLIAARQLEKDVATGRAVRMSSVGG
ncbi:hypothetical protein [Streptomyces cyanogenus]|uniref:Uncharacterized protein n=1 Tax=Streptomyces cyanogenus TaxID=80860 RepID=A0ABX7TTF0_STRCY|nr:hypothetical protein [Streptomyces cyanogenus]QTD99696.1 hypothetical protein S1361_20340 [Streptomyces cyanogenus]